MSANVVALPGMSANPALQTPQKDVVETLEQWLNDAKSGQIQGLVIAGVRSDGTMFGITTEWASGGASHEFILAAASGLEARVKAAWLKMNCPDG